MIILFFSLFTVFSWGQTCTEDLSIEEVLKRSITSHIDLQLKDDEIDILRGYVIDAEKIYNPELEHFTTTGDQFGQHNVTGESRLWFTFQLGNKRHRKGEVLRTQRAVVKTELEFMRMLLKKELFLAFIRNKQILINYERVETVHRLIESFIARYSKIKFLTPEQKIEKNSLEISVVNLDLQKAQLRNELEAIGRFFQRMTRTQCLVKLSFKNPKANHHWPDIKNKSYRGENSLEIKLSELALKKSQFELKREESMVWPDLKIGPIWQMNRLGGQQYDLFGVGLIFPIPSFNLNKGLREASSADIRRRQKGYDFIVEQKRQEFSFHVQRYTDILNEIKDYRRENEFNHILQETRNLFNRGLISIPIFLSYKSEFFEVINRSQNLETLLAQHLMEIYMINNEPLEEIGTSYLAI